MMSREGVLFVLIGLAATVAFLWMANRWDSKSLFVLSVVFGILTLFTAFFFRDPDRVFSFDANAIASPADGTIVAIGETGAYPFVGAGARQVSIFLSVFDIHVNRVPVSGVVEYVKYNPGEFLPAFRDKASELNEQTEVGITTVGGQRLIFKQIAGIIARRIVCRLSEGDSVSIGTRFGLIRFGSRVDLILPAGSEIQVKLGDHVRGGETVIGCFKNPAVSDKSTALTGSENVD